MKKRSLIRTGKKAILIKRLEKALQKASFNRFDALPFEIQEKIFGHALPARTVRHIYSSHSQGLGLYATKPGETEYYTFDFASYECHGTRTVQDIALSGPVGWQTVVNRYDVSPDHHQWERNTWGASWAYRGWADFSPRDDLFLFEINAEAPVGFDRTRGFLSLLQVFVDGDPYNPIVYRSVENVTPKVQNIGFYLRQMELLLNGSEAAEEGLRDILALPELKEIVIVGDKIDQRNRANEWDVLQSKSYTAKQRLGCLAYWTSDVPAEAKGMKGKWDAYCEKEEFKLLKMYSLQFTNF